MKLKILKKIKNKSEKSADKNNNQLTALDIGTENIKALIAVEKDGQLEIAGVGRQHQRLSDMNTGAISDISGVVASCEKALIQAEEQAGLSSKNVVIGIAGELVKGITTTVSYKRSNPKKTIDMEELEGIMHKIQTRAFAKAKSDLAWELGNPDVEVRMVNSAVVGIEIDGYKITNPLGFAGGDVVISLYTAFAPLIHLAALEKVAEELDLDLVAVAAEPFAVARGVSDVDRDSTFSAILIDVGGGTTDIAIVNEGGVEGTKMFGIGGRSFTHTIASELDIEFEVAEQYKLRSSEGTIEDNSEKVENSIQKTLEVWLSGVEIALGEFNTLDHLPSQIMLCGGGSSLSQLVAALKDHDWPKELAFSKKPTVKHIQPSQVLEVYDTTKTINDHTFITAMGLLRTGLDTIETTHAGDMTIRDKINKMLKI